MNRTDRLLAIVLELQAHQTRRAMDLAASFEISKRTVYRDIQALCEAGVPVIAEPGRGYSLVEGYFLPPLRFSADEATMLLLGADVMAQSFDAEYRVAAEDAARKIAGGLSPERRDEVEALRESFRFIPGTPSEESVSRVQLLRHAIIAHRQVRLLYHTRHSSEQCDSAMERVIDPYALVHVTGAWMLVAFCHTRQAFRHFRLDRIERPQLLDTTFERSSTFSLPRRIDSESRTQTVQVLFASEVARWVRESRSFYTVAEEDTPDGLLVTMQVRQEQEIVQWLLGWGSAARVLSPDSLRERLAREAAAMLANYRNTP